MNSSVVLNLFEDCGALLRGHFGLSNGLHTDRYLECARALQDAARTAELAGALIDLFRDEDVDRVVSPALGGLLIGYEVARGLEAPFAFVERGPQHELGFRRGLSILAGEYVLLVDDVLTNQHVARELYDLVSDRGGLVVGLAAIVDRSDGAVTLPCPVRSLVELNVVTYTEETCPMCRKGIPLIPVGGSAVGAGEP